MFLIKGSNTVGAGPMSIWGLLHINASTSQRHCQGIWMIMLKNKTYCRGWFHISHAQHWSRLTGEVEARQEWRMGPFRQCGKETCWSIYPSRSRVRWLRDCPQNASSKLTCETQLQDTSFLSPQRTLFPPSASAPRRRLCCFHASDWITQHFVLFEQMPQCFVFFHD